MSRIHTAQIIFLFLFLGALSWQGCKRDDSVDQGRPLVSDYDSKVIQRWNDVFLQLDRYAVGYRPGPVPHALGYMGFAAYEAVAPGMPDHQSLAKLYPDLQLPSFDENLEYHWPAVINESYAYLMRRFFFHMENTYPQLYGQIEATRSHLHDAYAAETTPEVLARSVARGRAVAAAFYEWEKKDLAAHNAFLDPQPPYNAPQGPGFWEPTIPDFTRALFPFWGQVRTFALREEEQIARPHIPYSENPQSLFFQQALEAYLTVNNIRQNGPGAYEQKWVAEFWSDDILGLTFSPPGRPIAIANQVIERERSNLSEAVEMNAKLGMALNDISVGIWQSKYIYNLERPVSYIRRVLPQYYPEATNWLPILNDPVAGFTGVTPAFPAYPSGHAGFAGASSKILSAMFEFNKKHPGSYAFTDRCHMNRTEFIGTPRTYASFNEAGYENALSRVPLGVHFRMDCTEGLRMGELAAQRILELPWRK